MNRFVFNETEGSIIAGSLLRYFTLKPSQEAENTRSVCLCHVLSVTYRGEIQFNTCNTLSHSCLSASIVKTPCILGETPGRASARSAAPRLMRRRRRGAGADNRIDPAFLAYLVGCGGASETKEAWEEQGVSTTTTTTTSVRRRAFPRRRETVVYHPYDVTDHEEREIPPSSRADLPEKKRTLFSRR